MTPQPLSGLPAPFHGIALDVVDSTSDEVRRQRLRGAGHGYVVRANRQVKGRGRRGRVWQSPAGNLYCSILMVPPAWDMSALATLSFVIALGVRDMIQDSINQSGHARALGASDVQIKWPNDVLIQGGKASGILIESETDSAGLAMIVGVGINLSGLIGHPVDAPYAISNLSAYGVSITPEIALIDLLNRMAPWYALWVAEGFAPIRQAWLTAAYGLDAPMIARIGETQMRGIFRGIDLAGNLQLEMADGALQIIAAADVFPGLRKDQNNAVGN